MRRRDVSPEELPRIDALRQGNASWLKIERETGIPRRIAKRAHEQWQRSRSLEQVKEARKVVAAEEFRKHLDFLTQMATGLLGTISVPQSADETTKAENVLARLWWRDMSREAETSEFSVPAAPSEAEIRRLERSNRMLFQSLQDHTQGKVRWAALEEWKKSWDSCISLLSQLQAAAGEVMGGYVRQRPGLKERLEKATSDKAAIDVMRREAVAAVWRAKSSKGGQEEPVRFSAVKVPGTEKYRIVALGRPEVLLNFDDKKVAEEAAEVCTRAAENLLAEEVIDKIGVELRVMQQRIEELEEKLEPLRLRPLILGSRCELCPA